MLIRLLTTAAFALVHCQVARSQAADASVQFVTVYESRGRHVKRSVQMLRPKHLNVEFQLGRATVTLRLRLNTRVNRMIPVTFEGKTGRAQYVLLDETVAAYQDKESGAAIMVTFTGKDSDSTARRLTLDGIFHANGACYNITPESTPSTGSRGTKHRVLRDHMGAVDVAHFNMPTADNISYAGMKKDESRRTKRSSGSVYAAYHLELQFIVDYTIWSFHMENAKGDQDKTLSAVHYYLIHIFNMMDLAFRGIDGVTWGYTIRLFLLGFHIAKSKETSWWTEQNVFKRGATVETTYVRGLGVLQAVGNWTKQDGRSWANPDHTVLFTRYNLVRVLSETTARDIFGSFVPGGICRTGRSISVIEAFGRIQAWQVAATDLGHSLGATNDGKGNNTCLASDGYLMTPDTLHYPTPATISNKLKFSDCSLRDMGAMLDGTTDGYPRVCLTNRVCAHTQSLGGIAVLPGAKYSLDEQCEMAFAKGFTFHSSTDGNQDICRALSCFLPKKTDFQTLHFGAMQGTPCGENKCCRLGLCSSDCSAPAPEAPDPTCSPTDLALPVPSDCIDQHRPVTINGIPSSCGEAVIIGPQHCFVSNGFLTNCCETCHKAGLAKQTQHFDPKRDQIGFLKNGQIWCDPYFGLDNTECGSYVCLAALCNDVQYDAEANKTIPPEALLTKSLGQTTTTGYRSTTSAGGSRATTSAGGSRTTTSAGKNYNVPCVNCEDQTAGGVGPVGVIIGASVAGGLLLIVIVAAAATCVITRRNAVKRRTDVKQNGNTTQTIGRGFDRSPPTVNVIATPAVINDAYEHPYLRSHESVNHGYETMTKIGYANASGYTHPLPPSLPPR